MQKNRIINAESELEVHQTQNYTHPKNPERRIAQQAKVEIFLTQDRFKFRGSAVVILRLVGRWKLVTILNQTATTELLENPSLLCVKTGWVKWD